METRGNETQLNDLVRLEEKSPLLHAPQLLSIKSAFTNPFMHSIYSYVLMAAIFQLIHRWNLPKKLFYSLILSFISSLASRSNTLLPRLRGIAASAWAATIGASEFGYLEETS